MIMWSLFKVFIPFKNCNAIEKFPFNPPLRGAPNSFLMTNFNLNSLKSNGFSVKYAYFLNLLGIAALFSLSFSFKLEIVLYAACPTAPTKTLIARPKPTTSAGPGKKESV